MTVSVEIKKQGSLDLLKAMEGMGLIHVKSPVTVDSVLPSKQKMTDEEEIAYINKHAKRLNKQAMNNFKFATSLAPLPGDEFEEGEI